MNEPRGHHLPLKLWRQHQDTKPIVVILCGAEHPGKDGSPRAGAIWATEEGYLLYAHDPVPAKKVGVEKGHGVTDAQVAEAFQKRDAVRDASSIKWREGSETAQVKPLPSKGTVVLIDRDDYWLPSIRLACDRHGDLSWSRVRLVDAARRGERTGKQQTVMPTPG